MKYVPALVVAATQLLGPLVATTEGLLLGVESPPGPWTVAGGGAMVLGCGLIAAQAQIQSQTVDLEPRQPVGGASSPPARLQRP